MRGSKCCPMKTNRPECFIGSEIEGLKQGKGTLEKEGEGRREEKLLGRMIVVTRSKRE